jgi:hypothetical protein
MQIVSRVLSPEPPLPIITLKPEKKILPSQFFRFSTSSTGQIKFKKKYSTPCTVKKNVVQISLKMINCIEKKLFYLGK